MIFGGKFVLFMTGFKNTSQITFGETVPGKFNTDESEINFVVPDISVLRSFSPYGTGTLFRQPGLYTDLICRNSFTKHVRLSFI